MEHVRPVERFSLFFKVAEFVGILCLFGVFSYYFDLRTGFVQWRLLSSIREGNLDAVKEFWEKRKFPENGLVGPNTSLLDFALAGKRADVVSFLLTEGGLQNNQQAVECAWKMAAKAGSPEMLKFLREKGPTLEQERLNNVLPFSLKTPSYVYLEKIGDQPTKEAKIQCFRELLENGANPRADKGLTLSAALESGYCEVVKLLVEKGGSIPDSERERNESFIKTVLNSFFSAPQEKLVLIKFLIENGADLKLQGSQKMEVLNLARDLEKKEPLDAHRQILELLSNELQ